MLIYLLHCLFCQNLKRKFKVYTDHKIPIKFLFIGKHDVDKTRFDYIVSRDSCFFLHFAIIQYTLKSLIQNKSITHCLNTDNLKELFLLITVYHT